MWTLVVLLVHSQLNHPLFRTREGAGEGGVWGRKEGRKEGREGGREGNKTRKDKKKQRREMQTSFSLALRNSVGERSLVLPVALLLSADSGYTFSLRLVVCKAGETNQNPS